MFKQYRANYSLWPERARPRRGRSLGFAIGSFALGAICAAAYGVVFGFSAPVAAGQQSAARSVVEHRPVYASIAPPVMPAPAQVETEYRSRPRAAEAKVRLPIIGSQPVLITGTDGHGGGDTADKLAGEAPAADVAASSGNPSKAKRDESEFAREVPLPEARPEQAPTAEVAERPAKPSKTLVQEKREEPAIVARDDSEPAREAAPQKVQKVKSGSAPKAPVKEARLEETKSTATERPAKSRKTVVENKTVVEKKRERPAKYAAQKNRQEREEPARRTARRQGSGPSITEVALQALRTISGVQGMMGMQGEGF